MMKKLLSALCALALAMLPTFSLAVDLNDCAIANAVVSAPSYVDLTAPFSGTLCPFDLEAGDTVSTDQELMQLLTTTLYATEEGKVSAVFAVPGDDAAALCRRYGALLGIEPEHLLQVQCSTTGAYASSDTRLVHLGETVYVRSDSNKEKKSEGRVIAVNENNYVVELLSGSIGMSNSVLSIYRNSDYESKSCIGKGTTVRRGDVLVQGAGRVLNVFVEEGAAITVGMPLVELMPADAAPTDAPFIAAPADGVVAMVAVSPGQQVWRGQLLARIYLTDALEVTAQVDEMDMGRLTVGDRVIVTLDTDETRLIDGTVTEISGIGVTRSNAAYFTVKVSIPAGAGRIGASASVYLPK